jgi:hypothetical protein
MFTKKTSRLECRNLILGLAKGEIIFCSLSFSSNKLKFYHSQEDFKAMLKMQEEERN